MVVVDPAADVGDQFLGNLRADVRAIIAADLLERVRVIANGNVAVLVLQRGNRIYVPVVILDDVVAVDHVNHR